MARRIGTGSALWAAAVGLCLARSVAAGTITGLEVAPSPACVDEEVTATVLGTGTCAAIRIQWSGTPGDETILNDVDFGSPPVTATHTYATAGDATVRAGAGSPDCSMNALVDLTVQKCGLTIEAIATTDALGTLLEELHKPRIDFAFGILEPGGPLVVGGSQFGLATGELWIEGAFGKRQLTVTQHQGDDEWHNGGIGALMPAASQLTGMDGPDDLGFEIWVETAAGKESNRWPLRFLEEVKELPRESVQLLSCGDDGNRNNCNSFSDTGDFCFFQELLSAGYPGTTIAGGHYNCLAAIGDDTDTDIYRVSLKNGWALQSFDFSDNLPFDIGHASAPSNFQQGAASWNPSVAWTVTPGDEIIYGLQIYIVGPKGIPHE